MNKYNENKYFNVLELFGGIGAPRKALENIGINVKSIDYVELDPYAVKAYNLLFDEKYKPQNIINWNINDLNINIDLLVHGSPCQDFSKAGNNDLSKGRSILYIKTIDIIENKLLNKPKFVLWENVENLTVKHVEHFNYYLNKMNDLGYKNYYKILNSLDFGVPQNRKRVFVLSIRKDLNKTFDFNFLSYKQLNPLSNYLDKNLEWFTEYNFKKYSNFVTIPRKTDLKLINGSYNRVWLINKYIGTITSSVKLKVGYLFNDKLYYRYLSEKESFILMGFSEYDFKKICHLPSNQLYKLVGNSICIPVLEEIFKYLLLIEI